MSEYETAISLQFPLVKEEDWPPVGSESLPFLKLVEGFKLLSPPLFVKDLSVDDIINITEDRFGFVENWWHLSKSKRSIAWLIRLDHEAQIAFILNKLRKIGCNTTGVDEWGCYSIDIPEDVMMDDFDDIIDGIDQEKVAVAFPSFRHPD